MEEREKYLVQIKQEKEKALEKTIKGSLRLCKHGEKTQYYLRTNPKDVKGKYIREKDFHIAQKLAQKDYDQKILRATEQEIRAIQKYLTAYPSKSIDEVYESLHVERQKIIKPIIETREQFIQRWQSVQYEGKPFWADAPELYTEKGERVRSKSEIIIANLLNKEGIPYRYECPTRLKGVGTVYPDFTVLNTRTRSEMYWEHLGMMDDPAYVEKALQKIESYEQNGIYTGEKLILTYETMQSPINPKSIKNLIHHYLE